MPFFRLPTPERSEKLGLLEYVNDEGKFWDRWDFDALAEEVSEWNQMIRSNLQRLKNAFGENVISPIE